MTEGKEKEKGQLIPKTGIPEQHDKLQELRRRVESNLGEVRGSIQRQLGWAPKAGWFALAALGTAAGFVLARGRKRSRNKG